MDVPNSISFLSFGSIFGLISLSFSEVEKVRNFSELGTSLRVTLPLK